MAEYIEREAAMSFPFANGQYDHENADPHFINGCESYREWLETIPAADVGPVHHGKWIDKCVRDWRCSECGGEIDKVRHVDGYCYDNLPRYCPDCGALMDKDGNKE